MPSLINDQIYQRNVSLTSTFGEFSLNKCQWLVNGVMINKIICWNGVLLFWWTKMKKNWCFLVSYQEAEISHYFHQTFILSTEEEEKRDYWPDSNSYSTPNHAWTKKNPKISPLYFIYLEKQNRTEKTNKYKHILSWREVIWRGKLLFCNICFRFFTLVSCHEEALRMISQEMYSTNRFSEK